MATASINIQKASSHAFAHNDRSDKVTYLIDDPKENEFNRSAPEAKALLDQYVEEAKQYRRENGLRAMKSDTVRSVEAVINLNAGHKLKDVEELAKQIEKEFGFRAVQIAIHRDEGHVTEDGRKEKNYHAHIVMCNLKPDGTTIQRTMKPKDMARLQDITAEALMMKRGKRGSEAVRLEHKQHKAREKERTEFKKQLSEAQKEAQELRYTLKEYQDRIKTLEASTDDRRELHALNRAVNKADGEDKVLLLKELDAKITEFQKATGGDLLDGYAINDVAQQSRIDNLKALTKENGAQIIEASKVKGFMGADKIDEKKLEENINATLSKHFAEHNKASKMIETFTKLRDVSLSMAKKIADHVAEKIKEFSPIKEHQKEIKKGMER